MSWLIFVALILIGLTWLYTQTMDRSRAHERFLDYLATPRAGSGGPDGVAPELASVNAGPLLDTMLTPDTGLSRLTAASCYAQDRAVELQLGGQYAQRTNNYRRDYPDNCSAPRSDFVDAMYRAPAGGRDGVGLTVPCAGACFN